MTADTKPSEREALAQEVKDLAERFYWSTGDGSAAHGRNFKQCQADLHAAIDRLAATPAGEQAQPVALPVLSDDAVRNLWDRACRTVTVQGGGSDVLVFADYLRRAMLAAAPAQAPSAQPLTEEQILSLVLPIANNAPSVFLALCYESGPYSVTKLRLSAVELVRAIERAHGIGATHA